MSERSCQTEHSTSFHHMSVKFELGKRSNRVKLCSNAQTNPRPKGISTVFPACALTNSLSLPLAHRQDPSQQNASPALQAQPVTEVHPQHRSDTQTLAGSDSVYMCLQCHGSTSRHLSLAMLHFTLRSELSLVKCLRTLRSEAVRIRTFFSHFFELSLFHHIFLY